MRKAFTLIELLVVIGIIVLLMAFLLPALKSSRDQAKRAESAALITGLKSNIEQYFQTFAGYPGPVSERDVSNGAGGAKITGTQNLLLGLSYPMATSGSVLLPATGNTTIHATGSTNPGGPVDLGTTTPTGVNRSYPPFYNPTSKELSPQVSGSWPPAGVSGAAAVAGTAIAFPTIFDRYTDGMPILYYRRTPNATGSYSSGSPGSQTIVGVSQSAGTRPYYWQSNAEYTNSTGLVAANGTALSQQYSSLNSANVGSAATASQELAALIYDTASGGAKWNYVLISAAGDRIYGKDTRTGRTDDIIDGN